MFDMVHKRSRNLHHSKPSGQRSPKSLDPQKAGLGKLTKYLPFASESPHERTTNPTRDLVVLMVQPALALCRNQSSDAPGFAYGGSVIQDVGYYPLGNQVFTNFPHYARSGDFSRRSSTRLATSTNMPLPWRRLAIMWPIAGVTRR